jgi:hypothetical protein
MTPDEALDRLHRAGWSVGETAAGSTWLVCGANGENQIHAKGRSQAEAWAEACEQAGTVGMLAPSRPGDDDHEHARDPCRSPSLEERIANLEAQNRDLQRSLALLRWVLAAFLTGVPAYGLWQLWFGTLHAPTLDTRRVIVRDHTDKVRLVLGCDDHLPDAFRSKYNPGVLLYDETGALRGHLYASDELSGLGLFDRDGKPRVAVTHRNGWSGCWLKDRGGALRVGMALDSADGPRFVVQDEAERPIVSLP